ELGYLSNPQDLRALVDGNDQKSLAETLAHALESFVLATSTPEPAAAAPVP
ncbi:MAG: hypothetical protein INF05_02410, partial [Methylobacterium sp.]|nr:hypothetical protein [Methylobacterium sp.]